MSGELTKSMKRVLVVYYSQTGQLLRLAQSVSAALGAGQDVELSWCELKPLQPYPFPWPFWKFFDQFPEAVQLAPPPLQPLAVDAEARFDLVILAYTVWYLSPSPPVTAFLKSDTGRRLLKDTPVVTLIACRNMWHLAQEQVKALLDEAGARLSDNIVLTDPGSSLASFVTTPRWMLTGRKDALWGLFPPAGIPDADIAAARRFGTRLRQALIAGQLDGRRPVLQGLGAVEANVRLIPSEKIGRRSFQIWGRLVRAAGPQGSPRRLPVLLIYVVFLITMIVTVVPVTMTLRTLLRPLMARKLAQQKRQFELPSGSGRERLAEFGHE